MGKSMIPNIHSKKIMSAVEAAYIAGLIDGEGTIGLWRYTRPSSRLGYAFSPACHIANTNLHGLEVAREMMGNGRIVGYQPKGNRKVTYDLQLTPNQIRIVLPQVRRYLQMKGEQADLLLEYLELAPYKSKQRDLDMVRIVEIYNRLANLNKRGSEEGENSAIAVEMRLRPMRYRTRGKCSVEDCDELHYAHGYCRRHHYQLHLKTSVPPVEGKCLQCGKSFTGKKGKKYCSTICGYRYRYAQSHPVPTEAPVIRECPECGTKFPALPKNKRFCSSRCYFRHYQKTRVKE